MTRLMYDSTDASAIPADARMVAGYVDGLYRWSIADWARFPNAVKAHIAVNPATNDGDVLDIEPGNWDAVASVDWVIQRRADGLEQPTVYCGSWAPGYNWQDVLDAHAARGVPAPLIWYANYATGPTIPDGCIGHQYADVGPYDLSVVADFWPGLDVAPPAPQPPTTGPDVTSALGRLMVARRNIRDSSDQIENAIEDLTT